MDILKHGLIVSIGILYTLSTILFIIAAISIFCDYTYGDNLMREHKPVMHLNLLSWPITMISIVAHISRNNHVKEYAERKSRAFNQKTQNKGAS